jgi:saccharopine dehydrogenase (NAD+, L-lysine forming)
VVADLDAASVGALVHRVGAPAKVRGLSLDAADTRALERALTGTTVVVQASIPRFNQQVQSAALATGTHYIDMAADSADPYGPSTEWERRGLLGIVGMGEDPGLSNLMARYAADRLDRVRSIRIRDGDTATSPDFAFLPLFSPETFIGETLTPSRIWDGGKYRNVPPFGEGETYEFPAPVGPQKVYSVDHEEVDSLPRFIGKGVQYVDFKLALDDPTRRTLELLRDLKLLDPGTPEAPGPRKAVLRALPKPAELAGKLDGYAALVVETVGESNGVGTRITLSTTLSHRAAYEHHGATATAYLTGTSTAVAVLLLLDGTLSKRGFLAPEALTPEPFFPKLREFGIPVSEERTTEQAVGVA